MQERQVAIRKDESEKILKIPENYLKKLIYNEVARCQPASLRKKLFYTFSFICFAFTLSERVCEYNLFQRKVVLLVICVFNHDLFKPTMFTIFLLNMSFEVLLSAGSCNIKSFISQAKQFKRNLRHDLVDE